MYIPEIIIIIYLGLGFLIQIAIDAWRSESGHQPCRWFEFALVVLLWPYFLIVAAKRLGHDD